MQEERRGEAERRRNGNVLAFKIVAIFSGACGSSRRPNPSFYTADQQNVCIQGKHRLISENTHSCQVAERKRRRRRRLRLSQLSGFLRKGSTGFSLRKWRMIKANETKKVEEVEEVELCKKRILMGEKCRPLNPSGGLHYDHHGILLPEDLLF